MTNHCNRSYKIGARIALFIVLAGIIWIFNSVAVSGAHASAVTQGLRFYNGKTVTMISPFPAGQGDDLLFRDVAAYLGPYLHATVNVESIPTAVAGLDQLGDAATNCLTIGGIETGDNILYDIANTPGINYNPAKEVYLGGIENPYLLVIATPQSGLKSYGQLRSFTKSNPLTYIISPAGSGSITTRLEMIGFNISVKYLTAYANQSQIYAGFLRGDGDVATIATEESLGYVIAHQAVPLAEQAYIKPSGQFSVLKGVPTIPSLEAKYPPKDKTQRAAQNALTAWTGLTSLAIGMPANTPNDCATAMRQAVVKALTSSTVEGEFRALNAPPGLVPWQKVKTGYTVGLGFVRPIKALLGYPPAS